VYRIGSQYNFYNFGLMWVNYDWPRCVVVLASRPTKEDYWAKAC